MVRARFIGEVRYGHFAEYLKALGRAGLGPHRGRKKRAITPARQGSTSMRTMSCLRFFTVFGRVEERSPQVWGNVRIRRDRRG